jgi:hypothetical protein
LVDFSFTEPRALLPGRENLDGHILTAPPSTPHLIASSIIIIIDCIPTGTIILVLKYLSESAFADYVHQLNLTGNTALDEQG